MYSVASILHDVAGQHICAGYHPSLAAVECFEMNDMRHDEMYAALAIRISVVNRYELFSVPTIKGLCRSQHRSSPWLSSVCRERLGIL